MIKKHDFYLNSTSHRKSQHLTEVLQVYLSVCLLSPLFHFNYSFNCLPLILRHIPCHLFNYITWACFLLHFLETLQLEKVENCLNSRYILHRSVNWFENLGSGQNFVQFSGLFLNNTFFVGFDWFLGNNDNVKDQPIEWWFSNRISNRIPIFFTFSIFLLWFDVLCFRFSYFFFVKLVSNEMS